jgi:hypothetical protein
MAMGAPTLYREEYCEKLIQHMATGRSFESFAAVIGTSRRVLYQWRDAHENFLHALEAGRDAHLKFMEDQAMGNLVENYQGPKLNTALFKLFMVNIHGWRSEHKDSQEKSEQTIKIVIDSDDANL